MSVNILFVTFYHNALWFMRPQGRTEARAPEHAYHARFRIYTAGVTLDARILSFAARHIALTRTHAPRLRIQPRSFLVYAHYPCRASHLSATANSPTHGSFATLSAHALLRAILPASLLAAGDCRLPLHLYYKLSYPVHGPFATARALLT